MAKTDGKNLITAAAVILLVGAGAAASRALAEPQAAGGSGYKLAAKAVVGGEGGWDYLEVDSKTHHAFISRGSHVMVVDETGKVIGDIPNTPGVHGIAFAPEFNKGFTTNGQKNQMTIFDMTTLMAIGTADTDKGPDGIVYDPASKRVFAMNGEGNSATAVDAATGKVAGTVPLGGGPEFAAADGKGHVFVNLEDKSAVVEVDSQALKVLNTWPLAPCQSPSGMGIDAAHNRLVIGCRNQMMAFMDSTSGKVVGNVAIPSGVDANRFDPGTGFAFASTGSGAGAITVAHEDSPDKFTVIDTIATMSGARTMALDYSDHTLYTVSAQMQAPPPPPADATPAQGGAAPPARGRGFQRQQPVPGSFTVLIYKR